MSKERWSMFCKQPLSSWTFKISSSASKTGTGCEMMTSTFNHRRQVTCSVTVTEFLRLIKRPEQTLNLQDISRQNKTCSSDVWRTNCSFYSHVSIGTCWRGWGWGRVWGCEGEGGRGMSTPSQLWLLLYHLSRVQSLNLFHVTCNGILSVSNRFSEQPRTRVRYQTKILCDIREVYA